MKILGIETSCDETAAAVVEDGRRLLSNVVASSADLHTAYGGVVPEIAARSHIEAINPVIQQALDQTFVPNAEKGERRKEKGKAAAYPSPHSSLRTTQSDPWNQIDGIAVTYGAGLGGSLLVGVMTARTLAIAKGKPLFACNHVEGHIYANFLTEDATHQVSSSLRTPHYSLPSAPPKFPMLGLIVSGGHSQLVLWRDHFDYRLLGQTQDDAIGEAFDKVAKMIGLPYPGGVSISKIAPKGDPHAYDFPKARLPGKYDFSFSGPKTAVLRAAQSAVGQDYTFPSHKLPERLSERQKADIAASFQRIAIETVVDKTILACEEFKPKSVVIGGGVAASQELRRQLRRIGGSPRVGAPTESSGLSEHLPPALLQYTDIKLMTDNAAMIAALGCFKMKLDQPTADPYSLEIQPSLSM